LTKWTLKAGESLIRWLKIKTRKRGVQQIYILLLPVRDFLLSLLASLRLTVLQSASLSIVGLVLAAGTAAVIWISARDVMLARLTPGDLVLLAAYVAMIFKPLETLAYTAAAVQNAAAGAHRVLAVLDSVSEVTDSPGAKDLPDRIEEDLFCEIEGEQKTLYRAELKRAQQILLHIKTQKELAQQQFHFLTSLLRLRQICCHPRLVQAESSAPSAKTEALLEQLEPLMDEGQKVLVFSQFVQLLDLLNRPSKSGTGRRSIWPVTPKIAVSSFRSSNPAKARQYSLFR